MPTTTGASVVNETTSVDEEIVIGVDSGNGVVALSQPQQHYRNKSTVVDDEYDLRKAIPDAQLRLNFKQASFVAANQNLPGVSYSPL